MKKRIITFLLALTVALGSFAPSDYAYAAESQATDESAAFVSCEEDEAALEESKDAANEEASEESAGEQDKELTSEDRETETKEQVTKESEAEEPVKEEIAKEETAAEDGANEDTAIGSLESTSEEASEEASEDEPSVEASEEGSLEAPIEETEDKELLDYTFKTNVYDTKTGVATDEDGKVITGWVNVDVVDGKTAYEVKAVGSSALARKEGAVYYISPETGIAVSGVNTIGKKRYLFYEDIPGTATNPKVCRLARNTDKSEKVLVDSGKAYYCVLPSGEICTGWQTLNDKEYHFNESIGIRDESKWVVRGKSWTYVDDHGLMQDSFGVSLSEDGVHYIDGVQKTTGDRSQDFYVFKGGVRLTGLVYFDKDDKLAAAANAVYARYCDPSTAVVLSGFLTVGGKKYYAGSTSFPSISGKSDLAKAGSFGRIKLNSPFKVDGTSDFVFAQKNGEIALNQLVTFEGKTYCAKADGMLCRDEYYMIKGKLCHFDKNGVMDNTSVSATSYRVSADGNTLSSNSAVYSKGKDSLYFYSDPECTKMLKNCWLVDTTDNSKVAKNRVFYLDKSGRAVKGIATVNKKKYAFDPATGICIKNTKGPSGRSVEISGKYYLVDDEGEVVTKTGFISYSGDYFYVKNAQGELATGLTTIKGKKYFFDYNGCQAVGGQGELGGKLCIINKGGGAASYVMTKKELETLSRGYIHANSDGSLITGWATSKGKKYYCALGLPVGLSDRSGDADIYSIGGKTYFFSDIDGSMIKNRFVELSKGNSFCVHFYESKEKYSSRSSYAKKNTAFYFGSNGVAVTGFKTVNGQKHYFYTEDDIDNDIYYGMMAADTTLNIGGKLYHFDENGLISKEISDKYHYQKDGSLSTGKTAVKTGTETKTYYHDPKTGEMLKDVIRKTGKKWFYYGKDGALTTNMSDYSINGTWYSVSFNEKDGSITGFYRLEKGAEKRLTSTMVGIYGGEYYFLGADGLPCTGMYKLNDSDSMDICGFPGARMYIESDGRCDYAVTSSSYCSMVKVGSKIYVLNNGHTVRQFNNDGTPIEYTIKDYSALPKSDRDVISMHEEQFGRHERGGKLRVGVKEDGSVGEWVYVNPDFDRSRVYFNKYGIPISDMGIFARVGKTWYVVGDLVSAGSHTFEAKNTQGKNVTLEISWDNNFKLGKVREAASGKLANGYYAIQENGTPVMFFKNGVLQTGKQTYSYMGIKTVYNINPDTGWYISG